jgi:hypothetical protein
MRPILLSLAGLAAVTATACTTVVPPAPQVVTAAPVSAKPSEYCREYTSNATVDGRPQETVGTACLGPDGTWRIVDAENAPENAPSSGSPSPETTVVPQTYVAAPVAYPAYPYPYPYPAYAYYPPPYYPYPYYYGPAVGIGLGFRFGGGGGHHHH